MAASASTAAAAAAAAAPMDDAADWGDGDEEETVVAAAGAAASLLPFVASLGARTLLLAAALPLQLCEHATVSLAAGIQRKGGSAGLAFAFLLSAPATNLASLIMLVRSAAGAGEEGDDDDDDDDDNSSKRPSASAAAASVAGIAAALVVAALALSVAIDLSPLEVGLIAKEEAGHGHGHGHHGHGPSEGVIGELWSGYEVGAPYLAVALLAVAAGRRVMPAAATAKVKGD